MGLLDDAIREHLELKRLRGADPSEVAREQREALDPPGDGRPALDSERAAAAAIDGGADAPADAGRGPSEGVQPSVVQAVPQGELQDVRQETAELDMRSVLHDGDRVNSAGDIGPADSQEESPAGVHAERDSPEPDGDSLEWEVPAGRKETLEETTEP